MKKYLAEMVGTMVLVLMGCGVAVSLGCDPVNNIPAVVGTSVAFGLAVVAMAYTIGGISGCHINPAITLGCFLTGRISAKDCGMYMLFQVIGAFIGSALLYALTSSADGSIAGTGANDLQLGVSAIGGLLAEIVFTCVFVLVVLGATSKTNGATNNFAGLAIGLSLVLVHLVCIRYTGTSVNPARSIAPAVFAGGTALTNLWIFIVGPFIGAALAALIWKCIDTDEA
ncbi:MAG: MIP family channel protein [Prevotella sp.]|jgi:aquaporin Z|nr:MIP family channel protein [Prevotella sp.]MBP3745428.1 MIP family channel protein [Prevotella sp.]MBQ6422841.1 MIP family channel protein [Prevotella sp.]MBR7126142.1 MIP family channel protein [Prevotella sp.]